MRTIFQGLVAGSTLLCSPAFAQEAEDFEVLRNTVVNLLQALIDQQLLSPDAVRVMVDDAQQRAEETVAAQRSAAQAEEDAVRVTFVPEVVKDEIGREVAESVTDDVVEQVVNRAKDEGWGVPGALPGWVRNFNWAADLYVRSEVLSYDEGNAANFYRDFSSINERGGFFGPGTLLNTTEDRNRFRARARLGFDAELPGRATVGVRLATGDPDSPVSMTSTLGDYGRRRDILLDQAFVNFDRGRDERLPIWSMTAGRMANPWYTTDLIFDRDLAFDGLTVFNRIPFGRGSLVSPPRGGVGASHVFIGAGAYSLGEVELSPDDKRLYSAQIGAHLGLSERWQFDLGFAYHNFDNISGVRNSPNSNLLDYTAPASFQNGNTLFDIRNDTDPNTALFALAADYELAAAAFGVTYRAANTEVAFTGEWLSNSGYDEAVVLQRTGVVVPERADGYEVGLNVTRFSSHWSPRWQAGLVYKYLERDATVDAFAESEFRKGGTDVQGWIATAAYGITEHSQLRFSWFSADEIDGAPFALDTFQLDVVTGF